MRTPLSPPIGPADSPGLVTRRRVLKLSGLTAMGLATAACTDTSDVPSGSSQKVSAGDFQIPASSTVPAEEAELRWTDSGDQKAEFFKPFFDAYHRLHDNVNVTYKGTNWGTIQQSITLGLRNGTAPDVFQLPASITVAQAVEQKWIGAFDDIVPDWPSIKERFPPGSFANGVTDFDDKTYAVSISSNQRMNSLLLYNDDYVTRAGHDLSKPPSWDEFRTIARDVTKQGDGKYFGLIMGLAQVNRLAGPVSDLAEMAGVHGGAAGSGSFDWKSGEYNFTNPILAEALEMFLAMKADGSIFPGSVSLDAAGARGRFPQGQAAMMIQGPWNIRPWTQGNPELKLGVQLPPQRDPADIWPKAFAPGGSNQYVYTVASPYPEVIGDLFSYVCSDVGQVQWASLDGAADPAAFPAAFAKADLPELERTAVQLNLDHMALAPEPAVRNPDVAEVYRQLKQIQPTLSDVCVGLFTGQLTDVAKQLQGVQDRSNQALDEAIATAKKRGANVSREDWVFADWDARKPYDSLYSK